MTPRLAQREIALAGVALLAAVVSLALTSGRSDKSSKLPQPAGVWYEALAGARGPASFGKRTACGRTLTAETEGVAHPVLPCGAKIYVAFHDRHVLTQVVDRGPYVPGRQFDLTEALAGRLGVRGVQQIEWAYARNG